jgi:1-deoxy-D-xylulose-5-phosphate synthase
LRKKGGISGFPKRAESEYDSYDTGHAGTAISVALGLAKARDLTGGNQTVIAFIGDGSFNNGLVYEALDS